MEYKEHIARAVEYIENHLADEIDLDACARACGYSKYYFLRVFKEAAGDVSGTEKIEIPGGLYALFRTPVSTHADFVNTIERTWKYIQTEWLPQSGYRRRGHYEFECYLEQSRAFSEKIYIPIEPESS
jgi:AraC family transcriptional regulator